MPRHESPTSRSQPSRTPSSPAVELYSPTARAFHWIVVALLLVQIPLGLYMVRYGAATNFAAPTGQMYDSHKLLGLAILLVVVLRLAYRLAHGAPAHEPTLETWHKLASGFNHWGLYLLLLAIPVGGWVAVSMYGPFQPFGIALPSLAAENKALAEQVFMVHKFAAYLLIAFVGIHVGAALYHHVIRGDNVLARMIPGLLRKH